MNFIQHRLYDCVFMECQRLMTSAMNVALINILMSLAIIISSSKPSISMSKNTLGWLPTANCLLEMLKNFSQDPKAKNERK